MSSKEYFKKIALGSCVYYTSATFFILFLYFALNRDLTGGMQTLALIAILPFAVCFSSANVIYCQTSLDKWLRVVLHYVLTVGGAFLFLYLPNKDPQQSGSQAFLLFLVFSLIYTIVMAIILTVSGRIRRVTRDEGKYHSVYRK